MQKYELRPYTCSDAPAVVEVINTASRQTAGFPRAIVDAAGNVRSLRFVLVASEKIVAVTENNKVK